MNLLLRIAVTVLVGTCSGGAFLLAEDLPSDPSRWIHSLPTVQRDALGQGGSSSILSRNSARTVPNAGRGSSNRLRSFRDSQCCSWL